MQIEIFKKIKEYLFVRHVIMEKYFLRELNLLDNIRYCLNVPM